MEKNSRRLEPARSTIIFFYYFNREWLIGKKILMRGVSPKDPYIIHEIKNWHILYADTRGYKKCDKCFNVMLVRYKENPTLTEKFREVKDLVIANCGINTGGKTVRHMWFMDEE